MDSGRGWRPSPGGLAAGPSPPQIRRPKASGAEFDSRLSEATVLQLYGNPISRAARCLWMLEEIGEPYQLIDKSTRADDLQTAEYLRLNPNARIPTLVDGETVLWESMAINIYLAQKYQGPAR